ncbi:MAG: glycerophosphodiester phosphodiesterase [Prevotella sp.]|nr:glycerophosphodiester phosphodiesterase [Prevotella sp.]
MIRLAPLFMCFLLSCSLSNQGLEEEELSIVIPSKEKCNEASMIIAHQGAWKAAGYPPNSLSAFKAALFLDIYGSECDVRQTKDGCLVVCHDETYNGMTIADNDYATLSGHFSFNREPLPLLEDFLLALSQDKGKVRLVLDLKMCGVAKLLNLICSYGVLDRVDFVSGNGTICTKLIKYGLGYKTLFLGGGMSPENAKKIGYGGIDYKKDVFLSHPNWINEAQALGLKVWVWTVNDVATIQKYIEQGVYVTTDKPELELKKQ